MSHPANNHIWSGNYKIPWDEPAFSQRMLAEHLTQAHDMASRRLEWIDLQVAWIHQNLLAATPARILDLGCGPGFYSHRLTALGHHCHGLDFSPAAIGYAHHHNPSESHCHFQLGDIRHLPYGGPYDLAMLLYGEMNVFSPSEILAILQRIRASLASPQSALILEIQTPESVQRSAWADPFEEQLTSGVFSDRPHLYHTECQWLPSHQVAVQTFTIQDTATGQTQLYRNTTQAWALPEFTTLLDSAGFRQLRHQPDWPTNIDTLALWSARPT